MSITNSLIHTFSGDHFEVAVLQCSQHGDYVALIRTKLGGGAAVCIGVMECTAEHLHELERLSKLAELLINHLRQGKSFQVWTFSPKNN